VRNGRFAAADAARFAWLQQQRQMAVLKCCILEACCRDTWLNDVKRFLSRRNLDKTFKPT
jgi:hypothetical protein